MIEFLRPWALALIPLPWLAWRLLPAAKARAGLIVPERLANFLSQLGGAQRSGLNQSKWRLGVASAGWLLLVFALSTPLTEAEPLKSASGRDLLLALDLSASMSVRDVTLDGRSVDRFTAVKSLAASFIQGREGDRVGLIVFADQTYLVAPLTYDVRAVAGFLDEVVVGLPGKKTAVGDAIGLAIKTLQAQPVASRVIILLSDGDNNAGIIVPKAAAEIAAKNNVRVHTIGFGKSGGANNGKPHNSLTDLATTTGGRHYAALTTDALRDVYTELDLLEPTETGSQGQLAERDWTTELLVLALLALLALSITDMRQGRL